jgi:hypothetical protein
MKIEEQEFSYFDNCDECGNVCDCKTYEITYEVGSVKLCYGCLKYLLKEIMKIVV